MDLLQHSIVQAMNCAPCLVLGEGGLCFSLVPRHSGRAAKTTHESHSKLGEASQIVNDLLSRGGGGGGGGGHARFQMNICRSSLSLGMSMENSVHQKYHSCPSTTHLVLSAERVLFHTNEGCFGKLSSRYLSIL